MPPIFVSSNRPKKPLTKSISLDHFGGRDSCTTSEDEDVGGGAPLGLHTLFSPPSSRRPVSSGNAEPRASSSKHAFQVGHSQDDDVFVDKAQLKQKEIHSFADANSLAVGSLALPERDEVNDVPLSLLHIDAQNIYPPTACLFAANLPAAFDDDKLEVEITRHLSQFGSVFVKIRRDNRQMPFAFCQFTCDADARTAEKNGSGSRILGRPIRLEMAKAHATWIVYKVSGKATTREEAIELLATMGDISRATPLDERMRIALRLPPAIVIQFRMYDPKRDIEKRYGNHRVFRVRAFEPKAADPVPETVRNKDDDAMLQYDRDRRSAYFGNLPPSTTDASLRRLVSECGQVVNIDLKRKFVPAGPTRSVEICFAFIEFMRPDSVDEAASSLNGLIVNEHTIRVERKQSQFSERPRRNFTARPPIPTRPHPHNRSQAQNWREPMPVDSRHVRGISGGGQPMYARSFSTPYPQSLEASSSSSVGDHSGYHSGASESDIHVGGGYHHAMRHVSAISPAFSLRAPSAVGTHESLDSDTLDTPKAVKFEGIGDSDDEPDYSEDGEGSRVASTSGIASPAMDSIKAEPSAPGTTSASAAEMPAAEAISPAAYPMMPPTVPPYGFHPNMPPPMGHPMIPAPMTPQGPMFYNSPYPGYGYSPLPTPMETYLYHQHIAMLAASYQEAGTPTRHTGPSIGMGEDGGIAPQYPPPQYSAPQYPAPQYSTPHFPAEHALPHGQSVNDLTAQHGVSPEDFEGPADDAADVGSSPRGRA